MPKVVFNPMGAVCEGTSGAKILAVALKGKVAIRYGCASCRCGTCAVRVSEAAHLEAMQSDERELLERMGLDLDGSIRLACRGRLGDADVEVDLAFQDTYSPDDAEP